MSKEPLLRPGARLGAYHLDALLGRGSAGEVWAARHETVDARVAVKVLVNATADEVRREVRALAGLRHPGIVFPYDHGEAEGRPWIAMERATGGSLADAPTRAWADVRSVLTTLLGALACAHAHGVVHRDLKARNVLVFPGEGVKLSDFSVARARGAPPPNARAGTLETMAPEQLRGELADQGPWTDLYALGCLAYGLVAGRPPFAGPDVARQHLAEPPPPLPWPALDRWVRWLLAKEPGARPRCAAEALEALPDADADEGAGGDGAGGDGGAERASVVGLAATVGGTAGASAAPPPAVAATLAGTAVTHTSASTSEQRAVWRAWRPRLPTHWRPPLPPPRPLPGAGLGLLDVRPAPTAGRDGALDRAWALVLASSSAPAHLHVEGPAGIGRAHLLGHVAARAAECGATVWRLPRRAAPDALARAACGVHEDDAPLGQALARAAWRLGVPAGAARALADPATPPAERAAAAASLLAASPAPRLVVAPEPDEDLLPVLLALAAGPTPVAVLTSGAPGSALVGAEALVLPPLDPGSVARLLADLVELEPTLAHVLTERAAGNPGRALGEVTAWARAGRLAPGPRGHVLHGETGAAVDPGDPERVVEAALHWLRHGRQDRALPVLDAAIAALDREGRADGDPTRLRAVRMRLGVLLALGAWDDAEAAARALLAIPALPNAFQVIASTGLADVLTVRGRPAEALAVLDAVRAEGDDAARLALYRAWSRLALGRALVDAAEELDRCLAAGMDPRLRVALLRQRATLAVAMGDPAARGFLDAAFAEAPPERHPGLHAIAGDCALLAEDDPAEADAAYARALARVAPGDPNRLVSLVNRGVARLALGDAPAARDAAREALPLLHRSGWRDHEAVAHALAWATEPDPAVAAEHGARARATAGTNALTGRLLARIEALVGRPLG